MRPTLSPGLSPCLSLFPRCFATSVLTSHDLENSRRGRKTAKGLRPHLLGVMHFSLLYHRSMPNHVAPPFPTDPTPHACDEDQETWSGLCRLTGWLASQESQWASRPNPVASKPTNQQTGDHMLPAPVVRARLSLCLFVSLCFDCSLDLWKDLSPLFTVRESTDAVIRLMFI